MMVKSYTINVDIVDNLAQNGYSGTVYNQGDINSAILNINVTQNEKPYDLTGATVSVVFNKPDGTVVYQDSTNGLTITNAVNGNISVNLNTQTLTAVGKVTGAIKIVNGTTTVETGTFSFTVKKSLTSEPALASDNELSPIFGTATLTTTDKSIKGAINEVNINKADKTALGDVTTLTTNAKTSVVAAINENVSSLADMAQDVKTVYGVKGDGVTDDTTALQNAFNSGKPLWFPPGTHCIISSALSTPSGKTLKIIGSGKDNCSIKQVNKALRLVYVHSDNSELSGISFYGNGIGFVSDPQNQNGALVNIRDGNGTYIHDCRFQDADYISLLVENSCKKAFITNNEFINSWAEEITFWASYGIIKGNLFRNSQFNAIVCRGSHEVLIEGNIFDTIGITDAAIDIRDSYDSIPVPCSRVSIQNNHFIDCWMPISSTAENLWVASTAYIVGQQISYNQNVYKCVTAGTSSPSTPPTGTGTNITDGTVLWNYLCVQPRHESIFVTDNKFVNPTKPSYDNFIRLQQCSNVHFNRNFISKFTGVRGVYITDTVNCEVNGNTMDTGAEGFNLNVDGLIYADNNLINNLTGTAITLRSPYSNYNTCTVNNNKFYNVSTAIDVNAQYIGRVQANNNMLRTITTMGIKVDYVISILETVGNVFADGNSSKTIQFTAGQPTTWVKGKNVGLDVEYGPNASVPANPNIGQPYFNTSSGLNTVYNGTSWIAVTSTLSGNTSSRPTTGITVGTPYFDTTLGKTVWCKTTSPVAWVDATGASV